MLDPTSSFGRRFKTLPTTPDRRPLPFGDVPAPALPVLPLCKRRGNIPKELHFPAHPHDFARLNFMLVIPA